MGSRNKTYNKLFAGKMLAAKDGLYGKELVRIFAQTQNMNPADMLPPLLNDVNTYFNEKVFETMGASTEISMTVEAIPPDAILSYIKLNIDPLATNVLDFTTSGNSHILTVYDYLSKNYTSIGNNTQKFYSDIEQSTWGRYLVEYPYWDYNGKQCRLKEIITDNEVIPEVKNGSYGSASNYYVTFIEDNGTEHEIWIPEDTRSTIGIEYVSNGEISYLYSFRENIIKVVTHLYTGLLLLMKLDFQMPEDTKYRKFMMARFGLNSPGPKHDDDDPDDNDGQTLQESLESNSELRDSFITYSSSRVDPAFGEFINEMYSKGNEVSCKGKLDFHYETHADPSGVDYYSITYRGKRYETAEKDEDGEWMPLFIAPIEPMKKLTMPRKFEAYNNMFCMWGFSEKTVKLKWYQTSVFRIIMMIISIVLAFITFGVSGLVMWGALQVVGQILTMIDPRIAAIVMLAIAIVTQNYSNIYNQILNITSKLLDVVSTFNQVAFQSKIEHEQNVAKKIHEQTKEVQDEIDEITKNSNQILISFSDKVDYLYNGNMEAAYQAPELIASSVDMSRIADVSKYYI